MLCVNMHPIANTNTHTPFLYRRVSHPQPSLHCVPQPEARRGVGHVGVFTAATAHPFPSSASVLLSLFYCCGHLKPERNNNNRLSTATASNTKPAKTNYRQPSSSSSALSPPTHLATVTHMGSAAVIFFLPFFSTAIVRGAVAYSIDNPCQALATPTGCRDCQIGWHDAVGVNPATSRRAQICSECTTESTPLIIN